METVIVVATVCAFWVLQAVLNQLAQRADRREMGGLVAQCLESFRDNLQLLAERHQATEVHTQQEYLKAVNQMVARLGGGDDDLPGCGHG